MSILRMHSVACRDMASRLPAALLLLRVFTGAAADAGAGGPVPVQAGAADGNGVPGGTSAEGPAGAVDGSMDAASPMPLPDILSSAPGTYGVPAPSPAVSPSPLPAELDAGAALPHLCMHEVQALNQGPRVA